MEPELIVLTGDIHGDVDRIETYCIEHGLTEKDLMIILGDASLNYFGFVKDKGKKQIANSLGPVIFCIQGNHEMDPETLPYYKEIKWNGGIVYFEEEYPNLLFAKNGEVYEFGNKKWIAIGGAYSVDKWYRLAYRLGWWKEEQLSEDEKKNVENMLSRNHWSVDYVLSHTVPEKYIPTEAFIEGIDQSAVDRSMEVWLDQIEERLTYNAWFAGHFHCEKKVERLEILYENYKEIRPDRKERKYNGK